MHAKKRVSTKKTPRISKHLSAMASDTVKGLCTIRRTFTFGTEEVYIVSTKNKQQSLILSARAGTYTSASSINTNERCGQLFSPFFCSIIFIIISSFLLLILGPFSFCPITQARGHIVGSSYLPFPLYGTCLTRPPRGGFKTRSSLIDSHSKSVPNPRYNIIDALDSLCGVIFED